MQSRTSLLKKCDGNIKELLCDGDCELIKMIMPQEAALSIGLWAADYSVIKTDVLTLLINNQRSADR